MARISGEVGTLCTVLFIVIYLFLFIPGHAYQFLLKSVHI